MSLLDNASLLLTPNAYKASKLYSVIPSNGNGDFTATRATTATRINSSGLVESVALNVPRLDYSLGGCPNILLEPQRTNLALQSSSFDNAVWDKNNTTVAANSTISPSGIQDADTIQRDGVLSSLTLAQDISVTSGVTYTLSVYAKKNTNNFIQITGRSTSFALTSFANFDLNNGVVGTVGATATATITNVGNGWYRCTATMAATATSSVDSMMVHLITSASAVRLEPTTLSTSVFLWGAQLEAGAYATSFIPTTTASVTRNQDVVIKTGVSSLIGQAQGTLFLEARSFNFLGNGAGERISLTDGTFNNRINIDLFTGGNVQMVASNSVTGLSGTISATGVVSANSKFKIAVAYDGANSRLYVNGTAYTTIVGTMPTFSGQLSVVEFNQGNTARPFFGRVEELIVFPTRLTNAQLAQLTTL